MTIKENLKSLVLSLLLFSVLYWSWQIAVSVNISMAPSLRKIWFVNVVAMSIWFISGYLCAFVAKNALYGMVFGMLSAIPVLVGQLIAGSGMSVTEILISTGSTAVLGLLLGGLGGLAWGVLNRIRGKISNKSLQGDATEPRA